MLPGFWLPFRALFRLPPRSSLWRPVVVQNLCILCSVFLEHFPPEIIPVDSSLHSVVCSVVALSEFLTAVWMSMPSCPSLVLPLTLLHLSSQHSPRPGILCCECLQWSVCSMCDCSAHSRRSVLLNGVKCCQGDLPSKVTVPETSVWIMPSVYRK